MDAKPFINYLLQEQILTKEQIQKGIYQSAQEQKSLLPTLIQLGFLKPKDLKQHYELFKEKNATTNLIEIEKTEDLVLKGSSLTTNPTLFDPKMAPHSHANDSVEPETYFEKGLPQTQPPYSISESDSSSENKTIIDPSLQQKSFPKADTMAFTPTEKNAVQNFSPSETSFQSEAPRYQLLETLGQGGMGVVECVRDIWLARDVALKRISYQDINEKFLSDVQKYLLWRFRQEASITAFLEHPNIIPLYDYSQQENGEVYFTMRKVQGQTLTEVLTEKKTEKALLSIFLKVCDAISYVHNRGVIHRDLKPDNIMIGKFGEVYVMDWGIAKRLQKNQEEQKTSPLVQEFFAKTLESDNYYTVGGIGTPGYMSPEQSEDANSVDYASDIYALGKILRECYTLVSAFEELKQQKKSDPGKSKLLSNRKVLQKRNEEKIPEDIQAIIKKATARDARKRYLSVAKLAEDIIRYQKNIRISVRHYSLWEILTKWRKRNRHLFFFLSLLLLISTIFISYFLWDKQQQQNLKFKEALRAALTEKEKAEALPQENQNATALTSQKIKYLLNSLTHLNYALSLQKRNSVKAEQLKYQIGKSLIQLSCFAKNYELAKHMAKEIKMLSFVTVEQKLQLHKMIQQEETKRLRKNLKTLEEWLKKLSSPYQERDDRKDAIFEISKMEEIEIIEKLLFLFEEGTNYFLSHSNRSSIQDNYYGIIVTIIGRMEKHKKKAAPVLLTALKKMGKKLVPISPAKRTLADITFMALIAEAFCNTESFQKLAIFQELRIAMGMNHLFWHRTEHAYKKLIQLKELEKLDPKDFYDYMARGLFHLGKQAYQKANEDFSKALEFNPGNPAALLNRGVVKHQLNDIDGAMADFNMVILSTSDNAVAYQNRGLVRFDIGDYQGSLSDCDKVLQRFPNSATAYNNRGNARRMLKDFSGALADYTIALKENPKLSKVYGNRGNLYRDLKQLKKALEDYNRAISLSPKEGIFYNNRGNIKVDLKDFSGALVDYNRAISFYPKEAAFYTNRGKLKKKQKDIEGALSDFSQAIRYKPKATDPYYQRGIIRREKGNLQEALKDFNHLLHLDPKYIDGYLERGIVLAENGEFQKAILDFNQEISLNPKSANAYINRATCNINLQKTQEAIKDLDIAIRLAPKKPISFYLRGRSYFQIKQKEKAQTDFITYLKMVGDSKDGQTRIHKKSIWHFFPELKK